GDLVTQPSAQPAAVAEHTDLDAVLIELVHLAVDGLAEELHESRHLGPRTRPVLGAERVEREDVDTRLVTGLHHRADGAHAGAVARHPGQVSLPRPAPVAVHDDADVPRQVRPGRQRDRGGSGWAKHSVDLEDRTPRARATFRSRAADGSDLEDLSLLLLSGVVNLADELIGDLLDLADGGLDLVLADVAVFFYLAQVVDLVATDVANRDTCLLCALVHQLHQLLAPLLGELRDGHADDIAVVAWVQAQLTLLNSLLDG